MAPYTIVQVKWNESKKLALVFAQTIISSCAGAGIGPNPGGLRILLIFLLYGPYLLIQLLLANNLRFLNNLVVPSN